MKKIPLWPRFVRKTVAALAELITTGISFALDRARHSCAAGLRGFADLIAIQHELAVKDQHLALVLNRLRSVPRLHRPYYSPEDRLSILRFHWQYGWSVERLADQFILDVSTVRRWLRVWNAKDNPGLFFGRTAWNRFHDAVNGLVHDVRGLLPEAHIGTRTLATRLNKAAIALSRSSVQRMLRKPPPASPSATKRESAAEPHVKSHTILAPEESNQTWHLDLTTWRFLIVTVHIAAVLDDYSRKLLSLRTYSKVPTTAQMLALFRKTVREHGSPHFLVTDHGSVFRASFKKGLGIRTRLVKGKVRSCKFNGKVERFFRTFKFWCRLAGMLWHPLSIQAHLERFQRYYNRHRTHLALRGCAPECIWTGERPPRVVRFLANAPTQPIFRAQRIAFEGDHHLPILRIDLCRVPSLAA